MLLDIENLEKGLQPIPTFKVDKNTSIPLSKVIGWKSPTEGIVRLDDGFYTLTKIEKDYESDQ